MPARLAPPLFAACLFLGAARLPAAPSLLDQGSRALDEGLPQVAAYKLRAFLADQPPAAERRQAALALAGALLAGSDAAGSLAALDAGFPAAAADLDDAPVFFARAQALAGLDRWPEALDGYSRAAEAEPGGGALAAPARFGQGEALLALDRPGEAAAVYRTLTDDPRLGESARLRCAELALDGKRRREAVIRLLAPGSAPRGPAAAQAHACLVGRLRLAQKQPALARAVFADALARPAGLSERLLVADAWGLAQACLDAGQPDAAQAALETLLQNYPRQGFLAETFAWLESLYGRDAAPDLSPLEKWAEDDAEPARAALALLTLGHAAARGGDPARAEDLLVGFGIRFPDHPLRARALLDLAELRLSAGRNRDARKALTRAREVAGDAPRWRTGLEALDARLALAENDRPRAAAGFAALAERLGAGPAAEAAAFNGVLALLRAPDAPDARNARGAAGAEAAFLARFPRSPLGAEFPLEEGLARAGQAAADPAAGEEGAASLRRFLDEHPAHARAGEAHLALAELAFTRPRPDLEGARRELDAPAFQRVASDAPGVPPAPDAAAQDRAEYLAVWLADAPGPARDPERAIALARQFLARRPDSPLAAETRLKLGEIYFARGDYADAGAQLERLAQAAPDSPLAEAALYLAGRAAAAGMSVGSLDRAVELFDRAAGRGGPLRLAARLRQAEVLGGRPGGGPDALTLYDGVLAATARPGLEGRDLESRCAALCGRGQTLLAPGAAAGDAARLGEAVKTFDELAARTPGVPLPWRREALTLKGRALERLGDADAALAAYDDALDAADAPPAGEAAAPEWTWFYRAGSDAARLLESTQKWAAAVAVYQKLAAADGPMKEEFETKLNRRRLEHFIWE